MSFHLIHAVFAHFDKDKGRSLWRCQGIYLTEHSPHARLCVSVCVSVCCADTGRCHIQMCFRHELYHSGIDVPRRAGNGEELPSARRVSLEVFEDHDRPSHVHTNLYVTFGQFLDHDMTRTAVTKLSVEPLGNAMNVGYGPMCALSGSDWLYKCFLIRSCAFLLRCSWLTRVLWQYVSFGRT